MNRARHEETKTIITWRDNEDILLAGTSWLRLTLDDGKVLRFRGEQLAGLISSLNELLEHTGSSTDSPPDAAFTLYRPEAGRFTLLHSSLRIIRNWFTPGGPNSCRRDNGLVPLDVTPAGITAGSVLIRIHDRGELARILLDAAATLSTTPTTRLPCAGSPVLHQVSATNYSICGPTCPQLVFDVASLARLGSECRQSCQP